MNDAAVFELVRRWHDRSRGGRTVLNDPFDKFICLWIAFNAWGAHKTSLGRDVEMIEALKRDPQLKASFDRCNRDTDFSERLSELKGDRIVDDRTGEAVSLDADSSFESVLQVVYKIRCNLFHGRKDPARRRDLKLVSWAYFVLGRVFDAIVRGLG